MGSLIFGNPVGLSVSQSVHQAVCLSLSITFFICLSLQPSLHQSIHLSLTLLQNLRVKRQRFIQKVVILVSIPGVSLHPLGPPKFSGDGSYGSQILPTSPAPHDTGKKIDPPAKSFSQKMIILVFIPGVVPTPKTPKIW